MKRHARRCDECVRSSLRVGPQPLPWCQLKVAVKRFKMEWKVQFADMPRPLPQPVRSQFILTCVTQVPDGRSFAVFAAQDDNAGTYRPLWIRPHTAFPSCHPEAGASRRRISHALVDHTSDRSTRPGARARRVDKSRCTFLRILSEHASEPVNDIALAAIDDVPIGRLAFAAHARGP
jgi:hypothetical protein